MKCITAFLRCNRIRLCIPKDTCRNCEEIVVPGLYESLWKKPTSCWSKANSLSSFLSMKVVFIHVDKMYTSLWMNLPLLCVFMVLWTLAQAHRCQSVVPLLKTSMNSLLCSLSSSLFPLKATQSRRGIVVRYFTFHTAKCLFTFCNHSQNTHLW